MIGLIGQAHARAMTKSPGPFRAHVVRIHRPVKHDSVVKYLGLSGLSFHHPGSVVCVGRCGEGLSRAVSHDTVTFLQRLVMARSSRGRGRGRGTEGYIGKHDDDDDSDNVV
jgi:hypothetical protein